MAADRGHGIGDVPEEKPRHRTVGVEARRIGRRTWFGERHVERWVLGSADPAPNFASLGV